MHSSLDIKEKLETLTEQFAYTALECLDSLLDIDAKIIERWQVTDQLQGKFDYIFTLESFNDEYESTLCIGSPVNSMINFFDCDIELEEAKDALAELANIFCAVLMDVTAFSDYFGVLIQSTPEEAVEEALFPKAWGVEGKIWFHDDWLYFGYSIQKNKFAKLALL